MKIAKLMEEKCINLLFVGKAEPEHKLYSETIIHNFS
jgi:hypothetical protein